MEEEKRTWPPPETVRCPCDCKSLPEFTDAEVVRAMEYLAESHVTSQNWSAKDEAAVRLLREGMNEEREHCDVTHGDPLQTARIAAAHLKEDREYYSKLKNPATDFCQMSMKSIIEWQDDTREGMTSEKRDLMIRNAARAAIQEGEKAGL